jgi:hypothetical protein
MASAPPAQQGNNEEQCLLTIAAQLGSGQKQRQAQIIQFFTMQKTSQAHDVIARKMVPETGIEPVTRGFSIRCSTN